MKNIFKILFFITLFNVISFGQNINPTKLFVQDLQTTMTRYDDNGSIVCTISGSYQNVIKNGQNLSVTSLSNFIDKNGVSQLIREIGLKMNTNTITNSYSFFIDMKYFLPLNISTQYRNYNLTTSGSAYEIPSQITIRQSLNPITMNYTFTPSVAGFSTTTTTIRFLNRTVTKREKVTVPTGTYMCYVITEDVEIKTNVITKRKVTRWVNHEIGLVKTETRDTNGVLVESEQLTRFQNPTVLNSK
jgi:hypothetical protein